MPVDKCSPAEVFFLGYPTEELFWKSFVPAPGSSEKRVLGVMRNIAPGWEALTGFGKRVTYPAKTTLDFRSDLGHSICYIESGLLEQIFWGFNGSSIYPILFSSGCLLNEKFFITSPHTANGSLVVYKCLQDTNIVLFEKSLFTTEFKMKYPQIINGIMYCQSQKFNTQIFFNLITSCTNSLSRIACYFAIIYIMNNGRTENLMLPNIQRLCALLHIHKSSFMRGIAELKNNGSILEYSSEGLIVGDIEKLKKTVFR